MKRFNTGEEVLRNLEAWKQKNEQTAQRVQKANEKAEAEKKQRELQELLKPVPPFTGEDATVTAQRSRLTASEKDYWFWDKTYFPPELYSDYAPPGKFHFELIYIGNYHDKCAHIVMGPRAVGKTATYKKKFAYDLLHGKRRYMALGCETLTPAVNSLADIVMFFETNDRIRNDYKIIWHQANEDTLYLQTNMNHKGTFVSAISLDRSTKGLQRGFVTRLDYVYLTDIENVTSSLTREAIEGRIARINEMRTSLTEDGTLVWEGNNFDARCAMNQLVQEQTNGILSEYFHLHIFPAWGDINPKSKIRNPQSLWFERYPAQSESEMKLLCKPKDEYDWLGNFQQTPRVKSGDIFPDTFYQEWDELPNDLKGVIWTDPNCSLKGKGNTTACTGLAWSPSSMKYYIFGALCKSYSDSDKLLKDVLTLRNKSSLIVSGRQLGFDGNVTQEATWYNHVRNFCRIHQFPFPVIWFRRYKVDDITKGAQNAYQNGRVLFPKGFRKTEEGKRYTDQLFSFRGKKANKEDDAPDSFISAFEFLNEIFCPSFSSDDDYKVHAVSTRSNTGKI